MINTAYLKYFDSWSCYKAAFSVLVCLLVFGGFLVCFLFCRIDNKMFEKESCEWSDCWQDRRVTAHPGSAGDGHALCPTHEQSWCSSQADSSLCDLLCGNSPGWALNPFLGSCLTCLTPRKASEELFNSFCCQLFQIACWSPLSLVSLTPFSPPVILAKELCL